MKITIVTGAFFPVPPIMGGAVEKVWFALGQEFVRRGHQVLHVSRAHPDLPAVEEIDGVQHRRVAGFSQPRSIVRLKLLDLIYSWRARRILPEADILVTNTFWLPILVRAAKRGKVYVHVQRGPKGQMRWYSHAARLCAVSRAIADDIIAEAPQLREKIRVLPNALPFQIDRTPSATREQTLLFVGRLHPEKGIELFLRGLAELSPGALDGWKVKIVGPHETGLGGGGDDFLRAMQSLGRKSGAAIAWLGKIFEPAELTAQYRSAQLFFYPSVAETGEALPVAPLEAMANGCAAIVSKLACFRDYITDDVNGFVFDHRAPEPAKALACRLAHVLALPPSELRRIGEAAQATASEFSVETVASRYLKDFESLLRK
jgi:glycosyltransferase involved in cell wall biosynthesis